MSVEYDLRLRTNLDARQILDLVLRLASGIGATATPGVLAGSGVTISALPESDLGKEIVKENYDLEPTVRINLRLDKFDQFDEGLKTVVKVSLDLLEKTQSDGVLLLNHDTPVLMRKAGKITLDSGPGFWPDLPSLVGQPHSIGRLSPLK